MSRRVALGLAMAALLWPSLGLAQDGLQLQVDRLIDAYTRCVRRAAIRLEPSGDAPDDVARAAVWTCAADEVAAVNAALELQRPGYAPSELRKSALYVGAAQAVGARLCRKTKDCDYAHGP